MNMPALCWHRAPGYYAFYYTYYAGIFDTSETSVDLVLLNCTITVCLVANSIPQSQLIKGVAIVNLAILILPKEEHIMGRCIPTCPKTAWCNYYSTDQLQLDNRVHLNRNICCMCRPTYAV